MSFKDLLAYQKSFTLAMEIFEVTKNFPVEERYSLTDQLRRCSRSIGANVAEAYRKRRYPAHFVSKLSDSDAENAETQVWLDFAKSCQYLTPQLHESLTSKSEEVGRLLAFVMQNPDKFTTH